MRQTSHTLDPTSLDKALTSLRVALEITSSKAFQTLEKSWQETLIAGVVQYFKSAYEQSWRALERKLRGELRGSSDPGVLSYQELIRKGYENDLIDDPEKWFEYRASRNINAPAVDGGMAHPAFRVAEEFLASASALLEKLQSKTHQGDHSQLA